jgi:hypothetical protein
MLATATIPLQPVIGLCYCFLFPANAEMTEEMQELVASDKPTWDGVIEGG